MNKSTAFELKSTNLPLIALLLKTPNVNLFMQEWSAQHNTPGFFDQDMLVLDLRALDEDTDTLDFNQLMVFLREQALRPIAFKSGSAVHTQAAAKAGLVLAPEMVLKQPTSAQAPTPLQEPSSSSASLPTTLPAPDTMVIDKPLRSGQRVYAKGCDLVVLAMVNPGAEVIADGNVHVYAPLRGRAVAGARGNTQARIFSLSMEPELVSIAGIYRTSEVPMSSDVAGKPAMVRLVSGADGDKLLLQAMHA